MPEDYFRGEAVLYDQHKWKLSDATSLETQTLKPGKFTLNLEKTAQRKSNLSNFTARTQTVKENGPVVHVMI